MGVNRYEGLDDRIVRLIKRKARQLVGKAGITADDREDTEQELALHLFRRLPLFNPARSHLHTFASVILDRKAASILAAKRAGIRDCRRCAGSLNELVQNGQGEDVERIEMIDADKQRLRAGLASRPESELRDLAIDVMRAVAALPPELRDLCIPLLAERVVDVARSTRIPRGTVYERLAKIRARFEDSGLRVYL